MKLYISSKFESLDFTKIVAQRLLEWRPARSITFPWWDHEANGRLLRQDMLIEDAQRIRAELAVDEVQGVKDCDVFVQVDAGGRGTAAELGIAIGNEKPILIYLPSGLFASLDGGCVFWHHPKAHVTEFPTWELNRVVEAIHFDLLNFEEAFS